MSSTHPPTDTWTFWSKSVIYVASTPPLLLLLFFLMLLRNFCCMPHASAISYSMVRCNCRVFPKQNPEHLLIFAAGNMGDESRSACTINAPGLGKNVLTVGASSSGAERWTSTAEDGGPRTSRNLTTWCWSFVRFLMIFAAGRACCGDQFNTQHKAYVVLFFVDKRNIQDTVDPSYHPSLGLCFCTAIAGAPTATCSS